MIGGRFDQLIGWLQEERSTRLRRPGVAGLRVLLRPHARGGRRRGRAVPRPPGRIGPPRSEAAAHGMPVAPRRTCSRTPSSWTGKCAAGRRDAPAARLPRAPLVFRDAACPSPTPPGEGRPRPDGRWPSGRPVPAARRRATGPRRPPGRRPPSPRGSAGRRFHLDAGRPRWPRGSSPTSGADVVRIESHLRRDLARENGTQPPGWEHPRHQLPADRGRGQQAQRRPQPPPPRRVCAWPAGSSPRRTSWSTTSGRAPWPSGASSPSLLAERPDLIVVSMPAVGSSGPHSRFGAIGPGVAAYAGINMHHRLPRQPAAGPPAHRGRLLHPALHRAGDPGRPARAGPDRPGPAHRQPDARGGSVAPRHQRGRHPARRALPERMGNRDPRWPPTASFRATATTSGSPWPSGPMPSGGPCAGSPDPDRPGGRRPRRRPGWSAEDDVERIVAKATQRRSSLGAGRPAAGGRGARPTAGERRRPPPQRRRDDRTVLRAAHPFGYNDDAQNQFIRPEGRSSPTCSPPTSASTATRSSGSSASRTPRSPSLFASGAIR